MKLSELEKLCREMRESHGDLPVMVYDPTVEEFQTDEPGYFEEFKIEYDQDRNFEPGIKGCAVIVGF